MRCNRGKIKMAKDFADISRLTEAAEMNATNKPAHNNN